MTEHFKQEHIGDATVVRLFGRMDAQAVGEMKEDFKRISGKYVLLNLKEVNFLDSSALGLIVSTLRRLREQDSDLSLCCLSPFVRTIFELTRLYKVFDIYESEALALSVHAQPPTAAT